MIRIVRTIVGAVASILLLVAVLHSPQTNFVRNIENSEGNINVLIYETESIVDSAANNLREQASRVQGVTASMFGFGQEFDGYGSKYAAVYSVLQKLPAISLVVISDGRDVLFNNPASTDRYLSTIATEFRTAFTKLTANYPGAIVISAEAQCCVGALTHVAPGGYYNADGSRNQRACYSGQADCMWAGDDKALPWESFMKDLAIQRSNESFDDVYLNAGLMAGTAGDLLRLIERAGIGKDEDDQAVLTDFMYTHPEAIVLDYGQTLFGNNRGGLGGMEDGSCMFALQNDNEHERLVHSKTLSTPLFVHSPGGFLQCHDDLATKLGVKAVAMETRRRLKRVNGDLFKSGSGCNYGGGNYKNSCSQDKKKKGGFILKKTLLDHGYSNGGTILNKPLLDNGNNNGGSILIEHLLDNGKTHGGSILKKHRLTDQP